MTGRILALAGDGHGTARPGHGQTADKNMLPKARVLDQGWARPVEESVPDRGQPGPLSLTLPARAGGGGSTGMRHDGGGSRCMDRPDDRPLTGALSSAVCYTPVSDRHGGPLRMRAACTTDVTSHVCDSSAVLKYHFAQYGEEDGSTHGSLLPPSTSNT